MKKIILILLLFFSFAYASGIKTCENSFLKSYKNIIKTQNNLVYFKDGSTLVFDDGKVKTFKEKLKNPSIKDMISQKYPAFGDIRSPTLNYDPGRFRNIGLFRKLYGKNKKSIEENLVKVIWLPNSVHKIIYFNKLQNAASNLQKVSNELDKLPIKYHKFITNIAGTFNYRKISGTNRLSAHSFGIAIDMNTKFSNYWRWHKNSLYTNQISKKIVDIFEKHGFIWGGRWYHYDTMHFEYRPEMLELCK